MLQDLRLALRSVVREPRFAATAIGTLALGIAASTAVFTLAYSIWLKPLPYADAARLVTIKAINKSAGGRPSPISDVELDAYQHATRSYRGIAAYMYMPAIAKVGDEPRRLVGYAVSSNLFDVLGTQPALGRSFRPEDEVRNARTVVLLSDAFWRREWGADPEVVGKSLRILGVAATIIGVMPPAFAFPHGRTDMWQPLTPDLLEFNRGVRGIEAIGRLKDGVALETAQAELDTIAANLGATRPDTNRGWGAIVTTLHEETFSGYRSAFATLLGAVGFLLLVGCANAGGLLLSRQISRQPAIALRMALGATRWRVIREVIVEGLVLAAIGGGIGVLMAWTATPALADLLPRSTPRVEEIRVNAAVLMAALAISLVAGLLSAIAPALRSAPLRLSLQYGSASISGVGRHGLQSGLVVAQFIVCIVLVLGGGLMLTSFVDLTGRNHGFSPEQLLTAHVSVPMLTPDQGMRYSNPKARAVLYQEILHRVGTLPDIESVASVTGYPASSLGFLGAVPLRAPGDPATVQAALRACSSGYFRTMGVPLIAGRMFGDGDVPEMVVSEALARQLWKGESAIGKQIALPPSMAGLVAVETSYSVVGVVGNMQSGATEEPAAFVPAARSRAFWTDLVIRTSGPPSAAAPNVKRTLRSAEEDLLIEEMIPMSEVMARRLYLPRAQTFVVVLFAGLSMLLAVIGLYSLIAHFVGLRRAEFGVRLALGANASNVRNLVMRRGLLVTVAGTAIGFGVAALLGQVLRNRMFGLQKLDPGALVAAPAILLACGLLATFVAARRAGDVSMVEALKSER